MGSILFTPNNIKLIMSRKKYMTRRLIKSDILDNIKCPYGEEGAALFTKESHYFNNVTKTIGFLDGTTIDEEGVKGLENVFNTEDWTKRPSMFQPKWASRLHLRIMSVKVEKLQDISDEDAIKKGVQTLTDMIANEKYVNYLDYRYPRNSPRTSFQTLWDSMNKSVKSWDDNPWVWVISFEVVEKVCDFREDKV